MSHKDGRVVLSAWVEPALRDYAREAAKVAGVQFSRWVEGAVQRAVAEQSAAKALRIYPVHASNLTDVVTALEDERDKLRARLVETQAEVEMLRGVGCREAKADEPESGPCGVCLRCAEERGARWALNHIMRWSSDNQKQSVAEDICRDARRKR